MLIRVIKLKSTSISYYYYISLSIQRNITSLNLPPKLPQQTQIQLLTLLPSVSYALFQILPPHQPLHLLLPTIPLQYLLHHRTLFLLLLLPLNAGAEVGKPVGSLGLCVLGSIEWDNRQLELLLYFIFRHAELSSFFCILFVLAYSLNVFLRIKYFPSVLLVL